MDCLCGSDGGWSRRTYVSMQLDRVPAMPRSIDSNKSSVQHHRCSSPGVSSAHPATALLASPRGEFRALRGRAAGDSSQPAWVHTISSIDLRLGRIDRSNRLQSGQGLRPSRRRQQAGGRGHAPSFPIQINRAAHHDGAWQVPESRPTQRFRAPNSVDTTLMIVWTGSNRPRPHSKRTVQSTDWACH